MSASLPGLTITATETEHLPFYLRDFEERLADAMERCKGVHAPGVPQERWYASL